MAMPVLEASKDLPLTVHTSPPDISVRHVARLMTARGVGSVVVVDGLKPIGILTDRDVVVRVTAPGLDAMRIPVGTVMSSPVVTVSERESVDAAIQLMEQHGIRRLPVVDEAGQLSTILTMDDILRLNLAGPWSLTEIIRQQTLRIAGGPDSAAGPDRSMPPAAPVAQPGKPTVSAGRPFVVPMARRKPLRTRGERLRHWVRTNWALVLIVAALALIIPQVAVYLDDAFDRMSKASPEPQQPIIVLPFGNP
jgi:predicted transcriptional regulator